MTELRRERPTDADLANVVAGSRVRVMSEVSSRRAWWRRLSRSTIALGVVGTVAAGGIAYAAVERTADQPPETHTGPSVVEIGTPGPGDKWLNVSVVYRCRPGESFALRDATSELLSAECDRESDPEQVDPVKGGVRSHGIRKSVRAGQVHGTTLRVVGDLSSNYRITASWGPRAVMEPAEVLPPTGSDGKPEWDIPDYTVNEYGLTVGRPTINTPESAYPDLFPVTFKGNEAYILKRDMLGEDAGNPKEALRQMKERRRMGLDVHGRIYQFVYAADGKTRLGKMYVGSYSSH